MEAEKRADEGMWKYLLEQVMAEIAEHQLPEVFAALAKRPAWKAAMAAREGKPAKGPPRIKLQYKALFSKADPVEVPFDTVEPIAGKLVVTFSQLPKAKPELGENIYDS